VIARSYLDCSLPDTSVPGTVMRLPDTLAGVAQVVAGVEMATAQLLVSRHEWSTIR
jgi:hypothetical protein